MLDTTQETTPYVLRVRVRMKPAKKVGSAINGDDLIRSIRVRRSNTCHLVCALTLRIMAIFEKCPAGLKARVR